MTPGSRVPCSSGGVRQPPRFCFLYVYSFVGFCFCRRSTYEQKDTVLVCPGLTYSTRGRTLLAQPRRRTLTFGVAVAGQAAVPLPLPVEAVLAALAARAIRVVVAVEAAESVPRLSVELGIKHALPGLAIAVAHWGAGSGGHRW